MGTTTSFFVYGRLIESDKYGPELLTFENAPKRDCMACYKHVVFSWALQKKHVDCRCLYLYAGSWRVAKAALDGSTLTLTFRDLADKVLWYECDEKLPPTYWPLCGRTFRQQFTQQGTEEASTCIVFKKK